VQGEVHQIIQSKRRRGSVRSARLARQPFKAIFTMAIFAVASHRR
jgi:hypothetical protein